jgi:hypothetical protein
VVVQVTILELAVAQHQVKDLRVEMIQTHHFLAVVVVRAALEQILLHLTLRLLAELVFLLLILGVPLLELVNLLMEVITLAAAARVD